MSLKRIVLLTSQTDLAADLLLLKLRSKGAAVVRLNAEMFPLGIEADFRVRDKSWSFRMGSDVLRSADISAVWFRRWPDLQTAGIAPDWRAIVCRDSMAFLEGWSMLCDVFWLNRPERVRTGENKLVQLVYAQEAGFRVPETVVANNAAVVRDVVSSGRIALFKPLLSSALRDETVVQMLQATRLRDEHLDDESIRACPAIYQTIVPGQEWRLTIVGGQVFPARICWTRSDTSVDVHAAHPECVSIVRGTVSDEVRRQCLTLVRMLGLHYAAIDAIEYEGEMYFLELNPSGQWGWIEQATNYPLTDALADLLISCGQPKNLSLVPSGGVNAD
ncbi:MAG: hypothetical protein JWM10_713 [Myxococcaceae bacterium]|nr:hypothetical protein [Myxococcaceae bacterium]